MPDTILFEIKDFMQKEKHNLKQDNENKFKGGLLFPQTHSFRPLDNNPSVPSFQQLSHGKKAGKADKMSAPVRDFIVVPNEINATPHKVRPKSANGVYRKNRPDPVTKIPSDDPWNHSVSLPPSFRENLTRQQDEKVSQYRVKHINDWVFDAESTPPPKPVLPEKTRRSELKLKIGVPVVRDRFPSKTSGNILNNSLPLYPHLQEDPVMVELNHSRWNCGGVLNSEDVDRFLPEPSQRNHESFLEQIQPPKVFTSKKNKNRDVSVVHFQKSNTTPEEFFLSHNDEY